MNDSAQSRPSTGRRLFGHLIRLVIGVVSLGGLALLVYLVVDAIAGGSVLFTIGTIILLAFGAPAFVLALLAVTWKTGISRVIPRLFRRQHLPPSSSPPRDPRA